MYKLYGLVYSCVNLSQITESVLNSKGFYGIFPLNKLNIHKILTVVKQYFRFNIF